jgi:lipoprotein signal peptidase
VSRVLAVRTATVAAVVLASSAVVEILVRQVPACPMAALTAACYFGRLGPFYLSRRENHGLLTDIFGSYNISFVVALLGCLLIVAYAAWIGRSNWFVALGVGLQLGGALANLLDRVLFHTVNDYLAVIPGVFVNLADVAIMLGAIVSTLAILHGIVVGPPKRAARPPEVQTAP